MNKRPRARGRTEKGRGYMTVRRTKNEVVLVAVAQVLSPKSCRSVGVHPPGRVSRLRSRQVTRSAPITIVDLWVQWAEQDPLLLPSWMPVATDPSREESRCSLFLCSDDSQEKEGSIKTEHLCSFFSPENDHSLNRETDHPQQPYLDQESWI